MKVKEPAGILKPETDYPVKIAEVMDFKKISSRKDTAFIYDFRQNASGIIKIKVTGKEGQVIRFTPGELLGTDSLVTSRRQAGHIIFRTP